MNDRERVTAPALAGACAGPVRASVGRVRSLEPISSDREDVVELRDCVLRVDDMLSCPRCRGRFEIPSHRSIAFL
jgi:hypothetical protein